jgi:hypothetical protein
MNRRTLFVFATWAATAAGAIGAGTAAVSVLGAGITDSTVRPMTAAEVQRELAASHSPAPSATPSLPVTPPPAPPVPQKAKPKPVSRSMSSTGGSVNARCDRTGAYLVSWSPAQGFSTGSFHRGPARQVSVEFVTSGETITMNIGCGEGAPVSLGITRWHARARNPGWRLPFRIPRIPLPISIPGL